MEPVRRLATVKPTYAAVYVLLVYWEDDDLGVLEEIEALADIFLTYYGFQVKYLKISSHKPDATFHQHLANFIKAYESPTTLLVVYYGGHGFLDKSRSLNFCCTQKIDAAIVKWYSHQILLENSAADILLLLDCCEATGGGGRIEPGTRKEVIAACGFGSETPGVGPHSFSRALIVELKELFPNPFSTAELHRNVLDRLRSLMPEEQYEKRQAPIYALMGHGGSVQESIRIVSYIMNPNNLIAVMGATASGKSSFINTLCGVEIMATGDSLESVTKSIKEATSVIKGQTVTLVDTPGFDDTHMSDIEVLKQIASYLQVRYEQVQMLTGIVYLRDIGVERMNGSAVKNLEMFVKLCGETYLKNVLLVTTKWDEIPADKKAKMETREQDLLENFWGGMLEHDCKYQRYSNTLKSAQDIVKPILSFRPNWLQIQRELGNGKLLGDTAAGKAVDEDVAKIVAQYEAKIDSVKESIEETSGKQLQNALAKQAEENQQNIEKILEEKKVLEMNQHALVQDAIKEAKKDFGTKNLIKQWTNRIDDHLPGNITTKKVVKYGLPAAGAAVASPILIVGAALVLL